MDQQSVREIIAATTWPRYAAAAALSALALFLLVVSASALKSYRLIGSGVSATNTIRVAGEGEVFAVPDTALFTASVVETAKDVAAAQDAAAKKGNAIIAYLTDAGVEKKDIQTTEYSVNPQYEWIQGVCSPNHCPPGKQTLVGFEARETLTVKVRDTKKAGELLSGVGGKGASQVSGLSFTIADEPALQAQAREKAIAQAREKADELAKALGVRIVRIVGFDEGGGGTPPIMFARDMATGVAEKAAVAPEIAVGQNKIVSNVSVTYEIQ